MQKLSFTSNQYFSSSTFHTTDAHLIQQLVTLGGALDLFPCVLQFGREGLEVLLESPSQLLVSSGFLEVPGLSKHAGLVQQIIALLYVCLKSIEKNIHEKW